MSTTLVRKRAAMRAGFSKSYKKLLDLLNKENPDVISIETHFRVLEARRSELTIVDQETYDNLLLGSVDKYNLKCYELRACIDSINLKTSVSGYTVTDVDCTMADELRNHKIQLAKDSDSPFELLMGADIAGKLWTGRRNVLSSDLIVTETVSDGQQWAGGMCRRLRKKENKRSLPTNHELALGRVNHTTKKLNMNKGLFRYYSLILDNWLSEGIIEEANDVNVGQYLPHRPVVKELSLTTRVLPVFDGSTKMDGYHSLNECLEEGSNLIELIPTILCNFREKNSTTVIAWTQRQEELSVLVRNRTKKVRELTRPSDRRHIPGQFKPADLPSRGCSVKQLVESYWWEGSKWLEKQEQEIPCSLYSYVEEEIQQETIVRSIILINTKVDNNLMYKYFSKYEHIVRMVGWILRFVNNCRPEKLKKTSQISLEEVERADQTAVRLLNTMLFERKGDISAFRTPVVLPSKHPVVEQLVYDLHCKYNHVGAYRFLSLICEMFWIIKGRQAVRRIIQKRAICNKFNVRIFDTYSPPLHDLRVNKASIFEVVGIDLTGPLILQDDRRSFHRFVARRGRPKVIYCDNGNNYRGMENMFDTLDWEQIAKYSTTGRIDWKFKLPSAACRICDELQWRKMNFIQNCDCEAQINSRPITYLSDDNAYPVPLTPSMFLKYIQDIGVPDCDANEACSMIRRDQDTWDNESREFEQKRTKGGRVANLPKRMDL
ncbi:hypothetical protein PR048_028359 [Dryococelus australis]|uniref:Uncharacterized protein n=1 Tax=Dryococelus australis TaxID=614101 RepID=A0ABQ9GJ38_9NEOP|nr:hypothetical protein PR048_028359 [Dryococelus australis]